MLPIGWKISELSNIRSGSLFHSNKKLSPYSF